MVDGEAVNVPLLSQLRSPLGTAADELISASLVWSNYALTQEVNVITINPILMIGWIVNIQAFREGLVSRGYHLTYYPQPNGVGFMFEGGSYYLDTDSADPNYIRVGFSSFWKFSPFDKMKVLAAANKITESMKAAKVYVIEDNVYCSVEQFVFNEEQALSFLPRYLRTLQGAVKAFHEQLPKVW